MNLDLLRFPFNHANYSQDYYEEFNLYVIRKYVVADILL